MSNRGSIIKDLTVDIGQLSAYTRFVRQRWESGGARHKPLQGAVLTKPHCQILQIAQIDTTNPSTSKQVLNTPASRYK